MKAKSLLNTTRSTTSLNKISFWGPNSSEMHLKIIKRLNKERAFKILTWSYLPYYCDYCTFFLWHDKNQSRKQPENVNFFCAPLKVTYINRKIRTSSMVTLVSAIFVERTIFRTPWGTDSKTLCCSLLVNWECKGSTRNRWAFPKAQLYNDNEISIVAHYSNNHRLCYKYI